MKATQRQVCGTHVAQTSKSAVSRISKSANLAPRQAPPTLKSATQQIWKSALRGFGLWPARSLLHSAFFLLPFAANAATNDLTSALQQGLFEEEANRNLPAAIAAYQAVALRFDQDRALAATAIFRLGECYRKQGKTNEAVVEYERILREFTDQQTLATLSRQNLTGMGAKPATPTAPALSRTARLEQAKLLEEQIKLVEQDVAEVKKMFEVGRAGPADIRAKEREVLGLRQQLAALDLGAEGGTAFTGAGAGATELAAQLAGIEQLKEQPEQRARAVLALYPDDDLKTMLLNLAKLQEQVARFTKDPTLKLDFRIEAFRVAIGPGGQGVHALDRGTINSAELGLPEAQAEVKDQLSRISERVDFILGLQNARLQVLQSVAQTTAPGGAVKSGATTSVVIDDEETEIRRLQAMIQNSPDLVNALSGEDSRTPLARAANKGQLRVVKFLLDSGADVNRTTRASQTPLHLATGAGHRAMVELLLDRGAAVDARDNAGWTALYEVAGRGFKAVAETLLAHKADVNAKASDGRTPLHRAADPGHPALLELLIANGANLNAADDNGRTPLICAAMNRRNDAVVKALLAAKADPALEDKTGRTALSYATERDELETVKALLAVKADPNAGRLNLPLHVAAKGSSAAIVDALLQAGADPDRKAATALPTGQSGSTDFGSQVSPLYLAVYSGRAEVVKMLLDHKADPNGTTPDGAALIFGAIGKPDVLKALLEAGARPNVQNRDGNYPLFLLVAENGPTAAIELLLAHGANSGISSRGWTPLALAAANRYKESVAALLKGGTDANAVSPDGFTALHYAVRSRDAEMVSLLLTNKAGVNARGKAGDTPLHLAVGSSISKLVELLLAAGADPNLRNDAGLTPIDLVKGTTAGASAMRVIPGPPIPLPRAGVLPAAGVPGVAAVPPTPASAEDLAALLRQHGALEWAPRPGQITVTRRSTGAAKTVFQQGTNSLNRFTLFEVIATLPWGPTAGATFGATPAVVPFPDFSKITIARSDPKTGKPLSIPVDAAALVALEDPAKDVPLEWGDVVDIPDREHKLNEQWQGLSADFVKSLVKCLERKITVEVKGQPQSISLWPQLLDSYGQRSVVRGNPVTLLTANPVTSITPPFRLKDALTGGARLLSTSDLTRVKVKRVESATGQTNEWVFNEQTIDPTNDLWLRDGDVIEVPEK